MSGLTLVVTEDYFNLCSSCAHWIKRTGECSAFPEGIPVDIFNGRASHLEPREGDGGIVYSPVGGDRGYRTRPIRGVAGGSPKQARYPKGHPKGGQWMPEGGEGGEGEPGDELVVPITLDPSDPLMKETSGLADVTMPEDNVLVQGGLMQGGLASRAEFRQAAISYVVNKGDRAEQGERVAIFAAGGGASGKTTLLNSLRRTGAIPDLNYAEINTDDIKEIIPEYQQIIDKGDGRAAAIVHSESSFIASSAYSRSLQEGRHVILDATLADPTKMTVKFDEAAREGYRPTVFGITVDIDQAKKRGRYRAEKTGRYVPESLLVDAHRSFNRNLDSFLESDIDFNLYESQADFGLVLVASSNENAKPTIHEPDLLATARTRANYNPPRSDQGSDQGDRSEREKIANLGRVSARRLVMAAKEQERRVDLVADLVLQQVSGVAGEWLSGVKPFFAALLTKAQNGSVTDADFIAAIEGAQRQLPELFDDLDTATLQAAFEEAGGVAVLSGSTAFLDPMK